MAQDLGNSIAMPGVHEASSAYDLSLQWNEPLNHPEFEGYYNYEGRRFSELTDLEKRWLEMVVHYPNIRNGIMKAPLNFRHRQFCHPGAQQPRLVRSVFGTAELSNKIVTHLIPRYEDLVNLCRASQLTAGMVESLWMHFDATKLDFLSWDLEKLSDVRNAEQESRSRGAEVRERFFSPSVFISPVREQDQKPDSMMTNAAGYPVTPGVERSQETDFGISMRAHYNTLHFAFLNGGFIKHLLLHGMPWVTVEMLKCILPEMPKLEALGIHNCFLMALGESNNLLRNINKINRERLARSEPHIQVDFSPFYFRGPPYKADGSGHLGEYGIVPEEVTTVCTTRAVTAQLLSIIDLCHSGKQDFLSPGTGFRSYLNRLPVRGLPDILTCVTDIHDNDIRHLHSDEIKPSEKLDNDTQISLWEKLIIACEGMPMEAMVLRKLLIVRGEVSLAKCSICETEMAAYFYSKEQIRQCSTESVCLGCELTVWHQTQNTWRLRCHREELVDKIFVKNASSGRPLRCVLRNIGKRERPAVEGNPVTGEKATPGREAIIARPGMVDMDYYEKAMRLWEILTVEIPDSIRVARCEIALGSEFPNLLERNEELKKQVAMWEFQLGVAQHNNGTGSLFRPCRSWELNIREKRAEIALRNGTFENSGPMPIFNAVQNVADMLGSSGGLEEYWLEKKDWGTNTMADEVEASKDEHVSAPAQEQPAVQPPASTSQEIARKGRKRWPRRRRPVQTNGQPASVVPSHLGRPAAGQSDEDVRQKDEAAAAWRKASEALSREIAQESEVLLPHQHRPVQTNGQPASVLPPYLRRPAAEQNDENVRQKDETPAAAWKKISEALSDEIAQEGKKRPLHQCRPAQTNRQPTTTVPPHLRRSAAEKNDENARQKDEAAAAWKKFREAEQNDENVRQKDKAGAAWRKVREAEFGSG
ncbi:hypothetical protein F4777DRAFT_599980 [Nemania sp. FL0916]|nr:hypothetical protein F4777DRAFT_599980 [Nemania sp. FL0916]